MIDRRRSLGNGLWNALWQSLGDATAGGTRRRRRRMWKATHRRLGGEQLARRVTGFGRRLGDVGEGQREVLGQTPSASPYGVSLFVNRARLYRTASAACKLILFAAFIKGTALGQVHRPSSFRLSELDNMRPIERRLADAIIKGDLPEAKAAADDVRLPQLQGFQEFLLVTGGESNAEVVTYFRDAYRLGITDLQIAVMSGDVDRVRKLLRGVKRDDSGIWGRGSDPHSELLLAIARKDANMVQVLLQSGADPNSVYGDAPSSDNTRNPQTPLKHAIRLGNAEIVKLLVAAGAEVEESRVCRSIVENVSAEDRERVDQLMLGKADGRKLTRKEHSEESNALLAAGILRESIREDANLYGPMVLAIEMGRESIVDALLDGGADPNVPIGKATTPLHKAVEAGHPGIVQRLIDKGAKVNALDSAGRTPIEYVYSPGALRGDILDILMKAGANGPEHIRPRVRRTKGVR